MPDAASIRKDAELVVDVCMTVEPDDVVTIITDNEHQHEAHAVAEVCMERGAWPVVMNNEMQVRRGLADTHFPMAPPQNLHQAMKSSDEIIIITNLEWANRFAHVSAVRESCDNNAKIASVEEGIGSWDLTEADIRDATDRARAAMAGLDRGTGGPGGARHRPRQGGYGGSRRGYVGPGDVPRRHRRPRLDRGAAGAGSDTDQEARPD